MAGLRVILIRSNVHVFSTSVVYYWYRWNFTVSRLQLSLLEGEGGYDQEDVSCQVDGTGASDWVFNADSTNGILFVSNR